MRKILMNEPKVENFCVFFFAVFNFCTFLRMCTWFFLFIFVVEFLVSYEKSFSVSFAFVN